MKYVKDPVHRESRLVVWAWGPWEREMLFNGCGVSAWCAEKCWTWVMVTVAPQCECDSCH